MKLKELLQIIQTLQEQLKVSKVMIVGGTPRDKVLNKLKNIGDLDLTTGDKSVDYIAKELSITLSKYFTLDYKTMADGHSSIFLGNLKVDFSSNFLTPNIDQILNKMGIKNPTDMQKELFSRDFTCNTLLMGLDLKTIEDPTGLSFPDIERKIIKTCLTPEVTLTTNKNRVVRAVYLAAKLDFDLDPELMKWIKAHPESIKLSSNHTLTEKLNKAIELNAERTTYLLDQMGLWSYIPISEELYPYYQKRAVK